MKIRCAVAMSLVGAVLAFMVAADWRELKAHPVRETCLWAPLVALWVAVPLWLSWAVQFWLRLAESGPVLVRTGVLVACVAGAVVSVWGIWRQFRAAATALAARHTEGDR